jgi:HAD superfamily hydrolase (TIGR01509 family)
MIKAVIFDLEGVLIDTKDWHYDALNRALAQFGHSISRHDHLVTFAGLPTRKKLEMLSREQGLPSALHGLINELKQRYTLEIVRSRCRPYSPHEYAVSHLKACGYKLAVASNAVRASVELMLGKAALAEYFDALVSNQDVRLPKPSPEIYLHAAERLGVSASECLVVEDNHPGVTAAEAAGAHVMVAGGIADVTWDNINRHLNLAIAASISPAPAPQPVLRARLAA